MSSNQEQEKIDQKILDTLVEIKDLIKGALKSPQDSGNPIHVDPSKGTCPQCGSANVHMGKITSGPYYLCKDCEFGWVNTEVALNELKS